MSSQEDMSTQQVQTKDVSIYVNGRERTVEKREYTFDEVVRWAYPNPKPGPDFEYTLTYSKGPDDKKEGTLVAGQSVKVKEDMVFNVYETNKS